MRSSQRRWSTAAAGLLLLAGGCTVGGGPSPSPIATQTGPPFTVMSTDPIRVTDPAAITDAASMVVSLNVFQRLMTADPGESALKPDAARDCIFTTAQTYTCTLNEDLTFHNGHALTASDVKFSIERATRLNVPGSSAHLLSSLRRIETPDDLTVRFVLSREDTQFGWALATPAASLVDEEVYDADTVRKPDEPIIGSGPFAVQELAPNSLLLARNEKYTGRNPADVDSLRYITAPDSATIEDALAKQQVDVVWRGINAAAITRYTQQTAANKGKTDDGYTLEPYDGVRVQQLFWSAGSKARENSDLRAAIAVALQGDRTSDSLVPGGVPGHAATFPLGGKAVPKVTWNARINLSLGYDTTSPDSRDLAGQIRNRLEETGGLSVQLRPDSTDVDLMLVDRKAWTPTALAWLQPYLAAPLEASAAGLDANATLYRQSRELATADKLLASLQQQSARDRTVLPVSQGSDYLLYGPKVVVRQPAFGPGWQLGLFGFSKK